MAGRGELERAVLHLLWDSPEGSTARELVEALPGDPLALTTILTVLDRLRRKKLVRRDEGVRPHRYYPVQSRDEFVAGLMLDALRQTPDREAALSQFLGGVSDHDADHLRGELRRARRHR